MPRLDLPPHSPLPVVSLRAPDLTRPAPGCAFAPRCPRCADDCGQQDPLLEEHENKHAWACFHPEEPVELRSQPAPVQEALEREAPVQETPVPETPVQEVRP